MKKLTVKSTAFTVALIAAGFSGMASAHETTGSLAATAGAIDVYHTSCFSWATAAAATAASNLNGDTEVAAPAGRFVSRVGKICTTPNATCTTGVANSVTVTISPENSAPTPLAGATGSFASTPATANNGGVNVGTVLTPNWVQASAFAQVANSGPYAAEVSHGATTGKNGGYTVAISHSTAAANNYWAQFHCEQPAAGVAPLPGTAAANLLHTGTGVTTLGFDAPNSSTGFGPGLNGTTSGTTGGDFNQIVNQ